MTEKSKEKIVFERKLRDDPIAYDVLNNPLIEGDIIIYAAQDGHRAELRVAKIIEARATPMNIPKNKLKLRSNAVRKVAGVEHHAHGIYKNVHPTLHDWITLTY